MYDELEKPKGQFWSHFKMFAWYICTEPFRKIKYLFKTVDREVTPSFVLYIVATAVVLLIVRNWKDITGWLGLLVVILVGLTLIWRRKQFVHIYRKEHYEDLQTAKVQRKEV